LKTGKWINRGAESGVGGVIGKEEGKRMKEENSELRERTKAFALRIIRMYTALPKTTEAQVLGKQVLRSGTSVGANYREAYRSRSHSEFIAKAGDSLKEIEETAYWLELLEESSIVAAERLRDLRQETDELIAIFVSIIKKAKVNRSKKVEG
jgi:four helix bundle protein